MMQKSMDTQRVVVDARVGLGVWVEHLTAMRAVKDLGL